MGAHKRKYRDRIRIRRTLVSILAGVVVFVTTYALVLPAITIDQQTAEEEPGLALTEAVTEVPAEPETEDEAGLPAETTETETPVDGAEPVVAEDTEEAADPEDQAGGEEPADTDAPAGPQDPVDPEDTDEQQEPAGPQEPADGEEEPAEPEEPIDTGEPEDSEEPADPEEAEEPADPEEPGEAEEVAETGDPAAAEDQGDAGVPENPGDKAEEPADKSEAEAGEKPEEEKLKEEKPDDQQEETVAMPAMAFRVEMKDQRAEAAGEELTAAEKAEEAAAQKAYRKAAKKAAKLAAAGEEETTGNDNRKVSVYVEAEADTFPAGTVMTVEEIRDEEILTEIREAAERAPQARDEIARAAAFDITFRDAEGNEIEPRKPIRVRFAGLDVPPADPEERSAIVVHLDDEGETDIVKQEVPADAAPDEILFKASDFSVYGIVYTVDFHYEANGKSFDYSLEGGGFLRLSDLIAALELDFGVAEVADVSFSAPEYLYVTRVAEDTTCGAIKAASDLSCAYSAELTEEERAAIDAEPIAAGDWALISLQAFDSAESLTLTLTNGDVVTVQVTDAQEIPDSSAETIDVNKSYLICYEVDGQYYLLKNDGSVDSSHTPDNFENLNSTYCWTFNYVFEEKHLDETLTYIYYLIRPIDNKTKTIALNAEGEPLVQRSNNNVAVVPVEGGGFKLIGYNDVKLDFADGAFLARQSTEGDPFEGVTVHIYEMDTLPTYSYTARSADEERGTVTIAGGTARTETQDGVTTHYYEAESTSAKMNAGTITATPVNHQDVNHTNKWIFDHWTQDGVPLDRDQYPATISADSLPIPFNGSRLVAYFRQNPDYIVPDSEKEASSFADMTDWLDGLQEKHVPLDEEQTVKTAEVYDYENRIYRVDIASQANFRTFKGDVDMAFCMDVSNSMYFPSKLVEADTFYDNNTNPIPIYQINNGGWGWSNKSWLDTDRDWNDPYYLIADQAGTATVFKVYYQDGNWKAQDASRTTESEKSFIIGQAFETNWTSGVSDKTHPFNAGDDNDTRYTIYDAGDEGRNRFYYLNQSFTGATDDLETIKGILEVAGDESPDIRIAYNTFNKELGAQRHDFQPVQKITIDLSNSHGGGTRPDQAFNNAQTFSWSGDDRYVILITDGAPQGIRDGESSSTTQAQIVQWAKDAATELKKGKDGIAGTNDDVKVITVGLSLDKVPSGKKLLYDIADNDKNGNKMFYMAESASDLPNILRQITDTIMDDAIVYADVTDTLNEAFYAVDKATGLPLKPGDRIDIEGRLTTDPVQAAGIVQPDGVTIKWDKQAIDPATGWHGTIYVKAKEDLIGGNAVKTNDNASVTATGYKMDDKEYTFEDSPLHDNLKSLEVDFSSPRVNVNELLFSNESTEWTVYLGTEVDPEAQLKKLYEDVALTEVVNEDGTLHYPLLPNSITDNREENAVGTAKTIPLSAEILKAIQADPTLAAKYIQAGELNWKAFLTDIEKPEGVVVPYHPYGTEGDDSNLIIKLTKEILTGEERDLVNHSPHATTVVNEGDTPVEKYVLTVQYNPDYNNVLPPGQGGHGHYEFGTGSYGAMYQGHAAGRETSTNNHIINVYKKTLDVLKTNEAEEGLAGATFKLYQKDEQNGVAITGLTGKYVEVASAVSGPDGIAHLESDDEDVLILKAGETYYLVEAAAPAHYQKVNTVWTVEVQPDQSGIFTDLAGEVINAKEYPFNWDQGARIVVDGQPVMVIAKGEEEGQTVVVNDGSFLSGGESISYRFPILNEGAEMSLTVNKTWENEDDPPAAVTFELYRVSEIGHTWTNGRVVPCTCTEDGVREFECAICGATDTYVIDKTGHTPGPERRENEVPATCIEPGGYDKVVRCKVCDAIVSTEHIEVSATGHDWGEWQVTVSPQPGIAGVETRYCKNDPSHIETRPIDPLPNLTAITYRTYSDVSFWRPEYGYLRRTVTTNPAYTVGSTVTLSWTSNNAYQVTAYVNSVVTSSQFGYATIYSFNGGTQLAVSRTGGNPYQYSVTLPVTEGMTVDLKSAEFWNYPENITITVNRAAPAFAPTLKKSAVAPELPEAQNVNRRALNKGSSLRAGNATGMTSEELAAYLAGLPEKSGASCEEGDEIAHVYKEKALNPATGDYTFTITGPNWTLPLTGLPKYNEYGNPYSYYVVETSPTTGYETTYLGQDTGLQDGGAAEIHNKRQKGSLLITKNVLYNGRAADTEAEKALVNGSYQFTVKRDGVEIAGSPFTITVTDGAAASLLIPELEAGDYTIEETSSGDLALTGASGGVSVTNKVVTASVTVGKITEAELLDDAKAAFTNNYTAYEVIIVKTDTGDTSQRLGGAVFDLYAAADVDAAHGTILDGATPLASNLTTAADGADKGKVSLGPLAAGTYYLFETQEPDGYEKLTAPVKIDVADNHVGLTQGARSETATIVQETAELTVQNTFGVALPHTGGSGTRAFYGGGALLLLLAGMLAGGRQLARKRP